MDRGLRKPELSAIPSLLAPAFAAAAKIWTMSSMGVLVPSLRLKFTVAPRFRAYWMLSTVFSNASSLVIFLCCRLSWLYLDSMVISLIPHSMHVSTLFFVGSAEAVIFVFWKVSLTNRLALRFSSSERVGNPTFMTAMPVSSMSLASLTCSTYVRKTVGAFMLSRNDSSQMWTFSGSFGGRFFLRRL